MFGRAAGDQRGIDGADGNAGDPNGFAAMLGQRFIDAALVRSERTAALQRQGDLLAVIFPRDGVHGPGFLWFCSGVIGREPRGECGGGA